MSDFAFASETHKPWLLIAQRTITQLDIPEGILLVELDAALMTGLKGLYRELAAALKLPDYFGNNFNSLDECLTDLAWLPSDGYLLLIKNSEYLLNEESDDALQGLLAVLDSAGEEWGTPVSQGTAWERGGVPFHTVFVPNERDASEFQLKIKRLGFVVQRLGRECSGLWAE